MIVGTGRAAGKFTTASALQAAAATRPARARSPAATTACATWSAITWSDVLRHRRALRAQQVKWATIAAGTDLDGSRLLKAEEHRTRWRFRVDIRGCGKTASQLASRDLAERMAAVLALPAARVRVHTDHSHAGVIVVNVQITDPWASAVPHPALAPGHVLTRRSITDGPLLVGENPDTGEPLGITA